MLWSVEGTSLVVTKREDIFFFRSQIALGLSQRISVITEGSEKAERL
jgi:hypothetical protein